jgi:hypothetical protein
MIATLATSQNLQKRRTALQMDPEGSKKQVF